jgi:hypothetical protein
MRPVIRSHTAPVRPAETLRGCDFPAMSTLPLQFLVRMARENPIWGCTRIRGALRNLGHEIGKAAWRGLDSGTQRVAGLARTR